MFDFLLDVDNYKNRAVARYEADGMIIDTAFVSSGDQPYETGIRHPEYNDGNWIIVEAYESKQEAQAGHDKWVARMSSANPPSSLKDCLNCGLAQLLDALGEDLEFPRVTQLDNTEFTDV